ncbi:nucleotidyltransferase substrate binding protein [Oceanobacter mangrovi]|uniref:nucleotidyltransferase substrate binding protein n=1 Tax=Oceanobacter mangrovi TaxID=2862510 RepID=UPI001C8D202F|nr:nucleotidyltransferase substrate binding protein [Oceanobacter mangrovi]
MQQDIRWQQRFANYQRALAQLTDAVNLAAQRELSELEKQGTIQAFEYTHELAWSCLKDFLQYQGQQDIYGSRDATRKAFEVGLIADGSVWMDMIASRNRSSHTYNQATANAILAAITGSYQPCFQQLADKLNELKDDH